MPEALQIGIIGAGTFAREAHLPALLRMGETIRVTAICDHQKDAAQSLAGAFPYPVAIVGSVEELLRMEVLDAVDIVLPPAVMPDVVLQALSAGKHVISEKPAALTLAAGRALLRKRAGFPDLVWAVAENWRHEEAIRAAARGVRAGTIGTVRFFQWNISYPIRPGHKYYHTDWRRADSFAGGYIFDGGVHHMAALRMILGVIEDVSAMSTRIIDDMGKMDSACVLLRTSGGVLGSYAVTYALDCSWDARLRLEGEDGTLVIDRKAVEMQKKNAPAKSVPFEKRDAFVSQFEEFYKCIKNGEPLINQPEESLRDVAVIEAILRAIAEKRQVAVEPM